MITLDDKRISIRLKGARQTAGKTQEEVAAHLGVARTTVVAIESGTRALKPDEFMQLTRFLGVSANALLHSEQAIDFTPQFRRDVRESTDHDSALETKKRLTELVEGYLRVESLLKQPLCYNYPSPIPVPKKRIADYAEDAAMELRSRLGLGLRPIQDLVRLAETELGLRVFERVLPPKISGAFAYSETAGACVVLNWNHPVTRRFWTLAHEIGHFLIDRDVGEVVSDDAPDTERFADAFAASFLMPAAAIRRRFGEVSSLNQTFTPRDLVYLALSFHVSVEAMGRRLERLKLLQSGTYDRLKKRGFKPSQLLPESSDPPAQRREWPAPARLNFLVAEAVARGLLSEGQASRLLGVDRLLVRELVEVLGDEALLVASA